VSARSASSHDHEPVAEVREGLLVTILPEAEVREIEQGVPLELGEIVRARERELVLP